MGVFYRLGIKERMKFLLVSALLLFVLVLPTVKGHCCGHCIPALCSCYQTTGGCDTLTADGDCDPPPNSHLCCAPKAAGDCNLFCCECSSCCTGANGVSSTISAAEKWRTLDKNNDKKLDEAELSLFLGNGTTTWTKYTLHHMRMTRLFMNAVDSNHNGQVDPWEMDSELKHMSKDKEL